MLPGGQTKEEVIETNERLRAVRVRLDENYDTAKKALVTLMARYSESKAQRNVFTRYPMLKAMIKVSEASKYLTLAITLAYGCMLHETHRPVLRIRPVEISSSFFELQCTKILPISIFLKRLQCTYFYFFNFFNTKPSSYFDLAFPFPSPSSYLFVY